MKSFLNKILLFLFLFTSLYPCFSSALSPEDKLFDDSQEQRAMKLFLQIRCLVCDGQVIESSDTEFSFEMRRLVRGKIVEGKTDEEIKKELVQEFGETILVNPQFGSISGILLWIVPLIFALTLALLTLTPILGSKR